LIIDQAAVRACTLDKLVGGTNPMQLGSRFVVPVWRPQTRPAVDYRAMLKLRVSPELSEYYILGSYAPNYCADHHFPSH
jgi:hypothetical protein